MPTTSQTTTRKMPSIRTRSRAAEFSQGRGPTVAVRLENHSPSLFWRPVVPTIARSRSRIARSGTTAFMTPNNKVTGASPHQTPPITAIHGLNPLTASTNIATAINRQVPLTSVIRCSELRIGLSQSRSRQTRPSLRPIGLGPSRQCCLQETAAIASTEPQRWRTLSRSPSW